MPIVDGVAATHSIRIHEQANPMASRAVQNCGRTPIFAISGMLRRGTQQEFIDAGFDGWMPKPVNIKTLGRYLAGVVDSATRRQGLYDEGRFELGGWFS